MRTVGESIVAMAELAEGRRARRRQARADTPSPEKTALVQAQRERTFPLMQDPFA